MVNQFLPKPKQPLFIGLVLSAIALSGGTVVYAVSQFGNTSQRPSQPAPAPVTKITALGRLEPNGEVVQIAAPSDAGDARIVELRVQEGEMIKADQIIAVLDSHDRLQDELRQAQAQVTIAETKLAQVRAGAKSGEVNAQQATIARIQQQLTGELAAQQAEINHWASEVRIAQTEFTRYAQLYQEGAISASNLDSKRLALETAQAQLNQAQVKQSQASGTLQAQLQEARATLDRIAEVRPSDVNAATAEVRAVIAAVKRAETQLSQSYIRAPQAGRILKIHTRAGEKQSSNGIVDLGQTSQMLAVAEVYQSDIDKVKVGQFAEITGQGFIGILSGRVAEIASQVTQQNVFSQQPGENLDRRVVEVKVRLTPEASQRVAKLTNLQVQVAIQP